MKFFLVVLLGMVAIINSKAIREEETAELNANGEYTAKFHTLIIIICDTC